MKNKRKIFEAPIDEPTGFSMKHHYLIVLLFPKRVKMIDNHLKKLRRLKDLEML